VNAMDWILAKFSSALHMLDDDDIGPGEIRLPEHDDLFFESRGWTSLLRAAGFVN